MISIEDMVRRELIVNVGNMIDDLSSLVAGRDPNSVLSFDPDDLDELQSQPDYKEAGIDHINSMDRDCLLDELAEHDLEDERNPTDIAIAAHHEYSRRLVAGEVDPGDGDTADALLDQWPGIGDADLRAKLLDHLDEYDDGWKDYAEENSLDWEYNEAYEFWAVTGWLAAKLQAKGEVVREICGLDVWGRTTTGQSIQLDWVIQEIYADLLVGR